MHHIYSAQEKKALMLKDWQIEWMHLQNASIWRHYYFNIYFHMKCFILKL